MIDSTVFPIYTSAMRYIKRVLDINHDLERKSQFLFGPDMM